MLRQSLKHLLASRDMVLPEEWGVRRPEELEPREFVDLTRYEGRSLSVACLPGPSR